MKITVYLKDPDGFHQSVKDAVIDDLPEGLDAEERGYIIPERMAKMWNALKKWVEYQECVTLEFDTEAGTAKVLERE